MLLDRFRGKRPYEELTAEQVRKRVRSKKGPQLLDVRTHAEFQSGHLPGAVHIPLKDLKKRCEELALEEEIIVYCKSSARSRRAASLLCKMGCDRVINMAGGLMAWSGPLH